MCPSVRTEAMETDCSGHPTLNSNLAEIAITVELIAKTEPIEADSSEVVRTSLTQEIVPHQQTIRELLSQITQLPNGEYD